MKSGSSIVDERTGTDSNGSRSATPVLAVGMVTVSIAAILVRLTSSPPCLTAASRTFLAGVIALGLARLYPSTDRTPWDRQSFGLAAAAGVFLAFHFWLWFESLFLTKVSISTLIVVMSPVWMVVIDLIIWRKIPCKKTVVGVTIAFVGAFLLLMASDFGSSGSANSDGFSSAEHAMGMFLAALAAISVVFYFKIGKEVLDHKGLWEYTAVVNLTSGILLLLVSFAVWEYDFKLQTSDLLVFLALAIFPSIMGHSSLNYSLKRLTAMAVVLVTIAEPILASIYAGIVFSEWPSLYELPPMLLILLGIGLGLHGEAASEKTMLEANAIPHVGEIE